MLLVCMCASFMASTQSLLFFTSPTGLALTEKYTRQWKGKQQKRERKIESWIEGEEEKEEEKVGKTQITETHSH